MSKMDEFDFQLGKYIHFKGGTYRAYGIVYNAEGEQLVPMVLYKNAIGTDFVRSIEDFTEIIELDGKKIPRFVKI